MDAERAVFYRETFNVDIEQPAQFDLFIDAGTTSLEAATEIVIEAFARHSVGDAVRRGA